MGRDGWVKGRSGWMKGGENESFFRQFQKKNILNTAARQTSAPPLNCGATDIMHRRQLCSSISTKRHCRCHVASPTMQRLIHPATRPPTNNVALPQCLSPIRPQRLHGELPPPNGATIILLCRQQCIGTASTQ
jgi:hypothetical protein